MGTSEVTSQTKGYGCGLVRQLLALSVMESVCNIGNLLKPIYDYMNYNYTFVLSSYCLFLLQLLVKYIFHYMTVVTIFEVRLTACYVKNDIIDYYKPLLAKNTYVDSCASISLRRKTI